MFAKSKSAPATGAQGLSFIGPEAVISGGFASSAHLHLDGRVDGGVRCATLIQGEKGTIAGDITAEEARLAGLVEGTVHARNVIVEASARITGDVAYETISIIAGAQIEGRLTRRGAIAAGEDVPALLIAASETAPTPKKPPAVTTGRYQQEGDQQVAFR